MREINATMERTKSKGTVIVVEDDMLLSLVETRTVERLGYEVVDKAISGEEAIQKIKAHDPDAVIMDISLKGEMDGIEVVSRVRSFSNVPVIYLSGNGDKLNKERARKTGYIDFLVKPINPSAIRVPLEKAIKEKKNRVLSHAS